MSQRDLKFPDRICLLSPTMGEICLWCIKKRRALSKPAQKKSSCHRPWLKSHQSLCRDDDIDSSLDKRSLRIYF